MSNPGVWRPHEAQTPAVTSLLTARVLDARTEQPIEEASLFLLGLERTARSNSLGNIRLTQLPAGKPIARASTVGYDLMLIALD